MAASKGNSLLTETHTWLKHITVMQNLLYLYLYIQGVLYQFPKSNYVEFGWYLVPKIQICDMWHGDESDLHTEKFHSAQQKQYISA